MGWISALLPATAIVAIGLFILREILEWVRRSRADGRKVEAFKTLLARECELNNWAHKRIKDAISDIKENFENDEKYNYSIKKRESGEIIFEERDEDMRLMGSWPLPSIHSGIMSKLMLDVATLDTGLFEPLENAYDAATNLNHIRQSLIIFVDDDSHLGTFVDYALSELPEIHAEMEQLYKACTGQELKSENSRIR